MFVTYIIEHCMILYTKIATADHRHSIVEFYMPACTWPVMPRGVAARGILKADCVCVGGVETNCEELPYLTGV